MPSQIIKSTKERMQGAVDSLKKELASIRTGRANPAILDGILVEYYGAMTPLNQLAQISVPEPQSLSIKPFDRSALDGITKAIFESNLGLTPNNDGETVRLNIPALTQERRTELTKVVRKAAENAKVSLRNVRRDANDQLKKLDGISEDEVKLWQDDVQKLTDDFSKMIDQTATEKEEEVKTI
jgi:ribosome recycling factor